MSIIGFVLSALLLVVAWLAWAGTRDLKRALANKRARQIASCWVTVRPHARCEARGHWPREVVRLADGTTVAHICRRCDHDWADEHWVKTGHEVKP